MLHREITNMPQHYVAPRTNSCLSQNKCSLPPNPNLKTFNLNYKLRNQTHRQLGLATHAVKVPQYVGLNARPTLHVIFELESQTPIHQLGLATHVTMVPHCSSLNARPHLTCHQVSIAMQEIDKVGR
jgi:hypothetical protein